MAQQALTAQAACRGRFVLGIGLSHKIVIEDLLGLSYSRPARLMREYLEVLLPLARGEADGAVPILTVRSLSSGADGAGSVEDSARRIEALDAFPVDLVSVPEGFRRTPHPLELMVAHAEREAELRRLMGGGSGQ